jgi:hypothetical protein
MDVHRLSVSFFLFALMVSTNPAASKERLVHKRHVQSAGSVQTKPNDRTKSVQSGGAIGLTSRFRAEDLIPDICKGCSS